MALVETIKFVMFYSLQLAVVAPMGIVLFAGAYQSIRDKVRQSRPATAVA